MLLNFFKKKTNENLLKSFGNLKEDSFDFELIETYFKKKNHADAFQVISDKTCNDLDFNEFFMFLDRTHSRVGQQYLYNQLRVIPSDDKEKNEKLIEQFSTDINFRTSVQSQLNKLNETEAFYTSSLFQDETLQQPAWYFVIPLLSFTSLISLILFPFNPRTGFILIGVFFANMLIHYWNKKNLYQYFGSIPQLFKLGNVARELFRKEPLRDLNPDLTSSLKVVEKVKHRMFFFNLEVKMQGDFQVLFWTVLEFIKIIFLLEPLLLFGTLRQLDTKRKELEDLFTFVGKIDALLSVASLRKGLDNYCLPDIISEQKTLKTQKVYHPLIPECVENDLQTHSTSILLTGSNMSGKTTFIRTIGINVLTGLTIHTCFAEHCTIPRMKIFSAIRISDDLMNDKSYYFEEVLTIREMIDQSQSDGPCLFLLDEIFKGTNTIERISAGKVILSALNERNNLVMVSTHDIELADLLKDEYELYHFSEIVDDNTVDFDYKLKEGKLKTRNAIKILQINNYPEKIVKEAMELSMELESKKH